MNIELTVLTDPGHVAALQARHDAFRRGFTGGHLLLSAGIIGLSADNQARIMAAVQAFDGFDADDLSDIHAIGDLEVELIEPGIATWHELVFFRIDSLGKSPASASAPTEPPTGTLTLTITLACEW